MITYFLRCLVLFNIKKIRTKKEKGKTDSNNGMMVLFVI